jgi:DNA-binding protein H-NS
MSLDDLKQPARKERKPREVVLKYRDPANPENFWSGRGKQPAWLHAHLDEGRQLNELLIEPASP